jgi:hypothetical protein
MLLIAPSVGIRDSVMTHQGGGSDILKSEVTE